MRSMKMKTLRITFLALGLAMVWLGFFYKYELSKQEAVAEEKKPGTHVEGFDTYTLENDQYEGEYSPQTEFTFLNDNDSIFLLREEEPALNTVNTASFGKEFELLEQEESSPGFFPVLLICSGAAFLFFGIASFRKSPV